MKKDISCLSQEKILQDELSILNFYTPNTRAPTYVTEALLKHKSHNKAQTLTVGYFNIPF